jgi:acyl-CoA thioesterase
VSAFSDAVVVQHVAPGRYVATLDATWNVARYPQGGIVAAIGLRAAQSEVSEPLQRLRSCTTVFAGPVSPGAVDVAVRVLRSGRSATQVLIDVRNAGLGAGATILAVFGSSRRGPSFVDVTAPDVPAPEDCVSYRDPPPAGVEIVDYGAFWRQVEARSALGHAPWERFEPTTSDVATWLRFDRPPRDGDGELDPLAVITLADRMPICVNERTAFASPPWFAPSADLTVHLFRPVRSAWVLAHDRARWADEGWASLQTTIWDEGRQLVAYGTQTVFFTYFDQDTQ